jgi:hypothetical protein
LSTGQPRHDDAKIIGGHRLDHVLHDRIRIAPLSRRDLTEATLEETRVLATEPRCE